MLIVVEISLLDGHFDASWLPVQVLVERGPQLRVFARVANLAHAQIPALNASVDG